jgi:TctA family transporter
LPTNSAKKRSKASEMFGKGAIEGIAASGKRQTML